MISEKMRKQLLGNQRELGAVLFAKICGIRWVFFLGGIYSFVVELYPV